MSRAPLPPSAGPTRSGRLAPLLAFLRRHPILCLFLLTPGLPEYLSGSSSFVFLVANPAWFLLALGINAAMYTSGALLVREALIRWNKGWPTVFALGSAYALMEEGIADQTIFNPHTSPLGSAGVYGHFAGVNWLWLPDILLIHILMSLFIPILLLGYALPETRGQSLLTLAQVRGVVALIALDTAFLTVLVAKSTGYWYGAPMLGVTVIAIVALCVAGYRLPRELPWVRPGPPTGSRRQFFLVGAFAYPLLVVEASVGAADHLSPVLTFAVIALTAIASAAWVLRHVGSVGYERHVVAFGAGLVVLGLLLGVIVEFPWEFVLLADAAVVYFLYWLDRDLARRANGEIFSGAPVTTAVPS
ncbi:MAG: hypothetical protein L3J91_01630 [Thermoplasmata archaeon]|nr:hypothetical protein [Thermoplasmata archaeon]